MTLRVSDYMNPRLVYLREGDRAEVALGPILDFGIGAIPVLDAAHRPVGVVSLHDLASHPRGGARATEAVATIPMDAALASAAKELANADVQELVVVDPQGRAVGVISAVDLIRGLIGLAAKHRDPVTQAK